MSDSAIEVTGYAELQRAFKKFDADAHKVLQKAIRTEALAVAVVARANSSWSATIPKSIAVTVTQRGAGIKTRRKVAPVGPLFERGGHGGGPWRHPLFGDRNYWFSQTPRPFIKPVAVAAMPHLKAKIDPLLSVAARQVGL